MDCITTSSCWDCMFTEMQLITKKCSILIHTNANKDPKALSIVIFSVFVNENNLLLVLSCFGYTCILNLCYNYR